MLASGSGGRRDGMLVQMMLSRDQCCPGHARQGQRGFQSQVETIKPLGLIGRGNVCIAVKQCSRISFGDDHLPVHVRYKPCFNTMIKKCKKGIIIA